MTHSIVGDTEKLGLRVGGLGMKLNESGRQKLYFLSAGNPLLIALGSHHGGVASAVPHRGFCVQRKTCNENNNPVANK